MKTEHPSIQRNKEREAKDAAMEEFTKMLLASDAAMVPTSGNSLPPLDPEPDRGIGDMPAGSALDPIKMSGVAIDMLGKSQKEDDGTPPSPPTQTTYERFQQEVGQFEKEKDANFLEDNWGKLLTVLAGTALQMVGVHNKNAPMFMGGNALAQIGGAAMSDYFGTKEREQQAIYDKYTKESGSARDVQSALAMAQDYYERTGEPISAEKAAEFLSLFNFTDEQVKSLSDQMMGIGSEGRADVKQALDSMKVNVNKAAQTYRQETGIVGAFTPEQEASFKQYVIDQAGVEGSGLAGVGTMEGAKVLDDYIATAVNQPMGATELAEMDLDQDQKLGVWSTDKETIMKWAGFPASHATAVDQININDKVASTTPIMQGVSDLGGKDVSQSNHITVYGKMADNMRNMITVKDGHAMIPKGYRIGSAGPSGAAYSAAPGAYKNVEYVKVLKHPVSDVGIESAKDMALKRLNAGLEGDETVFHPDFLAYIRQVLQEGIVRQ